MPWIYSNKGKALEECFLKAIDMNCYIGNWPFRRLRRNSMEDLKRIHAENGIESGYVSSLNSIFYNDPYEGEKELQEALTGTSYQHVMTLNPLLPVWEQDIHRAEKEMNIRGIKIFPGYHGYSLQEKSADRLYRALESSGLPLFVVVRMEDERLNYLMTPRQLSAEEICSFIQKHDGDVPIVLIGMLAAELMTCGDAIRKARNVYFDTSGLRNFFDTENLVETFGADKILYGSQFPLYCLKSSFLMTDKARIDEKDRGKIFCGNARRLMPE